MPHRAGPRSGTSRRRRRPSMVASSSPCQARFRRRDVARTAGRRAASAQASSHSWNAQSLSAGVYVPKNERSAAVGEGAAAICASEMARSWRATCSNAAARTSSIESK